ncbi:MAG TPA: hypothetical protein VJ725_22150 [Thermoanaerobaculia bacterium]|nr:hypothetical protein [Thermoanaerobaculia bacterium]
MQQNDEDAAPAPPRHRPPYRRLRVYAFDPSFETELDNAVINQVTLSVPWEADIPPEPGEARGDGELQKGPVGEYVEVIDCDPASGCFYAPVDLNDPHVLAQDGLPPSQGNPQFHQQMVYAVVMATIRNFERALGRLALWSPHYFKNEEKRWQAEYVRRLRIHPHALRQANAFYSPQKKALLFGYFPAQSSDGGRQFPQGTVFTCLSHDVIVHETTHALLDGLHRRFLEPSNPDSLAFHEAFSDIVALFQHFSLAEVLRHQIARTQGDLARQNLLGELAHEFGRATGTRGALRSAIGTIDPGTGKWKPHDPKPGEYLRQSVPHHRGAHLVAAVFDAFLSIYKARIADLLRIASGGTGRLPKGQLHPDLVNRLADEAAKSARHVLNMCIRALDYCPPVDLTFGEYLRALITADHDLVRNDDRGYRIAMIEAFRRRGIFPEGVRVLSEESLRWQFPTPAQQKLLSSILPKEICDFVPTWDFSRDRRKVFEELQKLQKLLSEHLHEKLSAAPGAFATLGLDPALPAEDLKVDSLRPARRIGPDGESIVELIVEITQRVPYDEKKGQFVRSSFEHGKEMDADLWFRGGCTVVIDSNPDAAQRIRYTIVKDVRNTARLKRQMDYHRKAGGSLRATYFGVPGRMEESEPFAMLHREQPREALDEQAG